LDASHRLAAATIADLDTSGPVESARHALDASHRLAAATIADLDTSHPLAAATIADLGASQRLAATTVAGLSASRCSHAFASRRAASLSAVIRNRFRRLGSAHVGVVRGVRVPGIHR